MAGTVDVFKRWLVSLFYGALVIFYILKQCFVKGFRQVFYWKRREKPDILSDPIFGTHGFLTLKEDVRIHYVASGPEDKPLMLFVHGFPEFWYSWRHQIKEFQKDYRVVAIDQRGYNESSKPSDVGDYSVSKLLSDLDQVITALGYKSCVLVGHDWGGAVVWAFGRLYSNRVDKLIVMNAPPAPIFLKLLQTNKKQQKMSWYMMLFQLPCLPELLLKIDDFSAIDMMFASERSSKTSVDDKKHIAENIEPYKYVFSQPGALTPPINYYRARFRSSTGQKTGTYDLEYTMPVLLIWGCKDKALDVIIADTAAKEITNLDVRKIPDAGHFVQFDAPDEVNKIMREWLKEQ